LALSERSRVQARESSQETVVAIDRGEIADVETDGARDDASSVQLTEAPLLPDPGTAGVAAGDGSSR
jgi:hypothetical protein